MQEREELAYLVISSLLDPTIHPGETTDRIRSYVVFRGIKHHRMPVFRRVILWEKR
jgi:hypothetical protein